MMPLAGAPFWDIKLGYAISKRSVPVSMFRRHDFMGVSDGVILLRIAVQKSDERAAAFIADKNDNALVGCGRWHAIILGIFSESHGKQYPGVSAVGKSFNVFRI